MHNLGCMKMMYSIVSENLRMAYAGFVAKSCPVVKLASAWGQHKVPGKLLIIETVHLCNTAVSYCSWILNRWNCPDKAWPPVTMSGYRVSLARLNYWIQTQVTLLVSLAKDWLKWTPKRKCASLPESDSGFLEAKTIHRRDSRENHTIKIYFCSGILKTVEK